MRAEPGVHLRPGDTVGNLRLESELGRGAFGAVFLARDLLIGRPVALKVLLPREREFTAAEREAFLAEARVIASLPSAHIVTLYSVHESADGGWLIEMEYVDGGTLFDVIGAGGRIPADRAFPMIRGVLEGLRAAHERGVLHRDIKPGNVLIGSDGSVKLADFGLAMVAGEALGPEVAPGSIVGTPWYIAPELFKSQPASIQTDLWATGVLIYEMLMGKLPYAATALPALVRAVLYDPPPPLRPDLAPRFGGIVAQCLAKRPEDRARSAAQLLAALDRKTRRSTIVAMQSVGTGRLFGRTEELRQIVLALQTMGIERTANVISIVGDVGAGKSVILEEAEVTAKPFGIGWLPIQVTASSGLVRPLLAAARARLAPGDTDEEVDAALESDAFGRATPVLRLMLQPGADLEVQSAEQATWALEQLLRGLVAKDPLCVAIDDRHLLDQEDVLLLRELTQRLAGEPFLLLMTRRPEASGVQLVGRAEGGLPVTTIELPGLAPEALFRLLEDAADGAKIQPRVAERIARRSGGNPLLAQELFRHLEQSGAIVEHDNAWVATATWSEMSLPGGLVDIFAQRLAALDDDDRELLEAGAVDGLTFDGEAVAEVLDISAMKVLRRLQRICRRGGLISSVGDACRFDHPMLRDLLYEQTAPKLRKMLHGALAEHLESEDSVDHERLGTHWEHAGDLTRAQPHLIAAAAEAARRLDQRRAIELFERSRLLAGVPDLDVLARHGMDVATVAVALDIMSRSEDASRLLETLRGAAEHADDAGLAARVDVNRALLRYRTGALDENDRDALLRAVDTLPRGRELGLTYRCLGLLAGRAGDLVAAETHSRSADEIFVEQGLEDLHAVEANTLGGLAERRGDYASAETAYAEAAEAATRLGRRLNAAISQINRVDAAITIGRLDGRRELLIEAIHTIELEGAQAIAAMASTYLANLSYALGDLADAVDVAERAVQSARPLEAPDELAMCLITAGTLVSARGRLEDARAYLEDADRVARGADVETCVAHAAAAFARLNAYSGELPAAEEAALRALEVNAATGDSPDALALELLLLAPLGVGARVWDQALRLLATAEELHESVRAMVESGLRGAIAFADPEEGPGDLDAAAAALTGETVGDLRAELRVVAQWFAAEAHRRRGDTAGAVRAANAAASAASLLGHVWLELGALRYLDGLAPSSVRRERRATLLRRLTAEIAGEDLRAAVQEAWAE